MVAKWMQFWAVNALSRQRWAGCMLNGHCLSAVVAGAQGGEQSGCKQPETRGFS